MEAKICCSILSYVDWSSIKCRWIYILYSYVRWRPLDYGDNLLNASNWLATRATLALPGGGITETYDRDVTGLVTRITVTVHSITCF